MTHAVVAAEPRTRASHEGAARLARDLSAREAHERAAVGDGAHPRGAVVEVAQSAERSRGRRVAEAHAPAQRSLAASARAGTLSESAAALAARAVALRGRGARSAIRAGPAGRSWGGLDMHDRGVGREAVGSICGRVARVGDRRVDHRGSASLGALARGEEQRDQQRRRGLRLKECVRLHSGGDATTTVRRGASRCAPTPFRGDARIP